MNERPGLSELLRSARVRTALGASLALAVVLPGIVYIQGDVAAPAEATLGDTAVERDAQRPAVLDSLSTPERVDDTSPPLPPAEVVAAEPIEPTPDGMRITLRPPEEPARSGPSDAIARPSGVLSQPAGTGGQLPLYLPRRSVGNGAEVSVAILENSYDCIIEPSEVIEVGSALTAVVESVSVERSDYIEAGSVVAQLEASPERANVAVARARAEMDGDLLARRAREKRGGRKLKRAEWLFGQHVLSEDLRDEISTEAEVAQAVAKGGRQQRQLMQLEYQEAVERLKEHTIRSPISGVVIDRLKSPGEVVKEETLMVVAQIDPLRVEVILPAAEFGAVLPGMRAEVVPELPNTAVRIAAVTIVDRVVDGTSGTFGVRLELSNSDHAVPSGLRCQVRFLQTN